MEKTKKIIGMLVAVEIDAVLSRYGDKLTDVSEKGFDVKRLDGEGYTMYIVKSGAGEIAAAAGTQFLITKYGAEFIINFGVVGGLTEEMSLAKTCVVESVVHYDYDTSAIGDSEPARYPEYPSVYIPAPKELVDAAVEVEPTLKRVICASGDKFVDDPEKKRALHTAYNADICEMEAAAILLTCNRNGVPCLMIKAVSDAIEGGSEEFVAQVGRSGGICLEVAHRVIEKLHG